MTVSRGQELVLILVLLVFPVVPMQTRFRAGSLSPQSPDFASQASSAASAGRNASPEQKTPLLLRDFKPVSMLHARVHNVDRARFPVIDVHQSCQ
jgi:hypothetical protein